MPSTAWLPLRIDFFYFFARPDYLGLDGSSKGRAVSPPIFLTALSRDLFDFSSIDLKISQKKSYVAFRNVHFSQSNDDKSNMPTPEEVTLLLPLVREYGKLERKRTGEGVTPNEFYRWSELRTHLEDKFPQGNRPDGGDRRATLRLPTKMLVEFHNRGDLQAALIRNISRGGLYIATQVKPAVGTELRLLITVGDGEQIELPVEVASSCILGPDSETGVGCKFGKLDATQQAVVDEMFATAIDAEV